MRKKILSILICILLVSFFLVSFIFSGDIIRYVVPHVTENSVFENKDTYDRENHPFNNGTNYSPINVTDSPRPTDPPRPTYATGVTGATFATNSQVPSDTTTNQAVSAYSYLIGVWSDDVYYAQQGSDGNIILSSKNASAVFNAVTTVSGNTIFVTDGVYVINSDYGIQIASDVTITGESKENTILKLADNAPQTCPAVISNIDFSHGNSNITIANLQIDGNWANQNPDAQAMGIQLVHVSFVTVDQVYGHDTAHDVMGAWYSSDHVMFLNNIAAKPASHQGIFLETGTSGALNGLNLNSKIMNNLIYGATNYAGIVAAGTNLLVEGNTISNCSQGIVTQGLSTNVTIASNVVFNMSSEGIYVFNTTHADVSENTVNNIKTSGIIIDQTNSSSITNNVLFNIGLDGAMARKGILISSSSFYNVISGNSINHVGLATKHGEGIEINGYCNSITENIIFDNESQKTLWSGIYLISGSNNLISGNRITDATSYSIYDGPDAIVNTITNNTGYNPIGAIVGPCASTAYITDRGTNTTWVSDITYTNTQSPKTVYVSGDKVLEIYVNGFNVGLTNGAIVLQPADTFKIIFSSVPLMTVIGQ